MSSVGCPYQSGKAFDNCSLDPADEFGTQVQEQVLVIQGGTLIDGNGAQPVATNSDLKFQKCRQTNKRSGFRHHAAGIW
jgi:hypothetical protein